MRVFAVLGLLCLAACTAPEHAFPDLAAINAPPPAGTTADQRRDAQKAITADGDAAREAGRMVRAGEELSAPLPPQPR